MKKTACLFLLLITAAHAADLIDVLPVNSSILMLHFDEGRIQHHGCHQSTNDETTLRKALDTALASRTGTWRIFSNDDADFSDGLIPVQTGRKSKPMDVSEKCRWNGSQCDNDFIYEHWIYLKLNKSLKAGKTYSMDVSAMADNIHTVTFVFDASRLRSETIHVNQIGFRPAARKKFAYLSHWMGGLGPLNLDAYSGQPFHLVDMVTGNTVYTGRIELRKDLESGGPDSNRYGKETDENGPYGSYTGADVYAMDFSAVTTPGDYKIVVDNMGCSFPFEIKDNIYREPYYWVTRALYHQRSGIALTQPFTDFTRPRTQHYEDGFNITLSTWRPMDGEENKDMIAANSTGHLLSVYGWYQDAGDWDAYPRHVQVPAALCALYELHPERYTDGELNIPESGNGIPDILDEAGWLVHYWQRAKGPNGGVLGRTEYIGDLERGVPSWEDPTDWYAFGEEPQTNLYYAAAAAQYAHCLQIAADYTGNAEIAAEKNTFVIEAKNAYTYALNNMQPGDAENVRDDQMWAAAALYKVTGEAKYQNDFESLNQVISQDHPLANPGAYGYDGDYNQQWAVWTYIMTPDHDNLNTTLRDQLIAAVIKFGDRRGIEPAAARSYPHSGEFTMPVVVGQQTTPRVFELIYAYEMSRNPQYLDCIEMTCDYFLGGNPLNMTWISGLGDRHPKELLDLDSWYLGHETMIPGVVPYGHTVFGDGQWVTPHDSDFNLDKAWPASHQWPAHELWFESRVTPITNEFTVDQFVYAAAAYGYLVDGNAPFQPNQRPAVTLTRPLPDTDLQDISTLTLEAEASDSDGHILKVDFYQDHHKLASVHQPPYIYNWSLVNKGRYHLIAEATDNKGKTTRDSLDVFVRSVISNADDKTMGVPAKFGLHQNFPNPFNPNTCIEYTLNEPARVNLILYDVAGRKVCTLLNEDKGTGSYSVNWNGRNDAGQPVSSGIYIYALTADSRQGRQCKKRKLMFLN